MNIQKVNEIQEEHVEVVVEDYISKKRYFEDSEIAGWVLMKRNEEKVVYYLYRRGYDQDKEINEPLIFVDQPLQGEELEDQKDILFQELRMQNDVPERAALEKRVKEFF